MLNKHVQLVGPTNILRIFININGLLIVKSSNVSLWPILCSDCIAKSVCIVGAYYGKVKPENNNILQKFVEAICLINNLLNNDGQRVETKLHV